MKQSPDDDLRKNPITGRRRRFDHTQYVRASAELIAEAGDGWEPEEFRLDWSKVDPELAWLADNLDAAMPKVRKLQRQLRAWADSVAPALGAPCAWCQRPVKPSEAGQRVLYCSRNCRQRAYEARRARATGRIK